MAFTAIAGMFVRGSSVRYVSEPPVVTASGAYDTDYDHAKIDASGGAVDLTLPDAETYLGRRIQVTAVDISGGNASITASGTDTIKLVTSGSLASYTFPAQWASLTLEANYDGSAYYWLVV